MNIRRLLYAATSLLCFYSLVVAQDASARRGEGANSRQGTRPQNQNPPSVVMRPGSVRWKLPLGGNVGFCSPAIGEDGTIYIGAGQQKLYALNPDGTEKWSVKTSGWVMGAPAICEVGTIYLGTHSEENESRIHAFGGDGSEKWSFPDDDTIP